MNIMKEIRIEKITLNIGTGEAGAKLDKALRLLNALTNQKPVATTSQKRIPTWGVRPGLTIGAKVTIRKNQEAVLKRMLAAVGNQLHPKKIGSGIFSFGISEYIQIPDSKYDIEIGIIGLGVMVTLYRPGYRVKKRTIRKNSIPKRHSINEEETMEFLKSKFNIQITEEER